MARPRKERGEAAARMDMTPMIDVTFLLLIFFLCLEFKTLEGKLATNLPKEVGLGATPPFGPIEKLDLRIVCREWGQQLPDPRDPRRFELTGHQAVYFLGPQGHQDDTDLRGALGRAAAVRIPNREGRLAPRAITIKTGPGVTYGDVTRAVDLALDSGFEEITFAGGEGTRNR